MADEYRILPDAPPGASRFAIARLVADVLRAIGWVAAVAGVAFGMFVSVATGGWMGLVVGAAYAVPALAGGALIHLLCEVARAIFDIADRG